uniref:LRRCT domain-containing protein n=1 Tax=Echeneis naucrates TaxID=173247 RepID=A0A665W4T5_ECHNA
LWKMSSSLMPLLPLLLNTAVGSKLCPSSCLCYESSDLVDCGSGGLVRVPPGVPHGTWLLDLSGNKLTVIHSRSFLGLWSLKILRMSNNSITTLEPQFLEKLDLSFNQLRWLRQDFSQSLSSLLELRLDHNLLEHLGPGSLGDLENLRKLDLSSNQIGAIDVRAFAGLSRLSFLSLEANRLNVLEDGLLSRQQRLEVLLLSHNNISVIQTEALAPLWRLTLLGLRGNQLDHIRFKTFLQLQTTSTELQMSLNPWSCDCELERVFNKIRHVRHLQVGDYSEIICHAPAQQAGSCLAALHGRLCVAETASVLVITITVTLAVIGALVKAEHKQKSKQAASDAESER